MLKPARNRLLLLVQVGHSGLIQQGSSVFFSLLSALFGTSSSKGFRARGAASTCKVCLWRAASRRAPLRGLGLWRLAALGPCGGGRNCTIVPLWRQLLQQQQQVSQLSSSAICNWWLGQKAQAMGDPFGPSHKTGQVCECRQGGSVETECRTVEEEESSKARAVPENLLLLAAAAAEPTVIPPAV